MSSALDHFGITRIILLQLGIKIPFRSTYNTLSIKILLFPHISISVYVGIISYSILNSVRYSEEFNLY
jgi:hypothetical protein